MSQKVTPFLWLPGRLEEAVEFYTSVFPDGEVIDRTVQDGELFIATFRIGGVEFSAMNAPGGPPFSEALSLSILCDDQAEVDRYWDALLAGGGRESKCGWLADRFGVSWQVVPKRLLELQADPNPERRRRAVAEMLTQVKLDIAALERAADGA
jgi:predicted 3-demethylubiquinone-9 3-methyltransferase (glyoxalase superfamily)